MLILLTILWWPNRSHRIQIFDSNGLSLRIFGSRGSQDSMFSSPWALAVDGIGNILVCDQINHRIQAWYEWKTVIQAWVLWFDRLTNELPSRGHNCSGRVNSCGWPQPTNSDFLIRGLKPELSSCSCHHLLSLRPPLMNSQFYQVYSSKSIPLDHQFKVTEPSSRIDESLSLLTSTQSM